MSSSQRWILVALLLFPLSTSAEELTLGADAGGAYESNVFSSRVKEVDDYAVRVGPHAMLEDREGGVQWELRYQPTYDYFIQTRDKRGWTHRANGRLSWQVNPTTSLMISDQFGRFRTVTRFNEEVTLGEGADVPDVTRTAFNTDRNLRNTFNATLTHNLAPTRQVIFDVGHSVTDFGRRERSDRETVSATARYMQRVSPRNTLGGGGSYRSSSLASATSPDGTTIRKSQSTDFYNVFASWQHQFDPTFDLSLAAGPTWVNSNNQSDPVTVAEGRYRYPVVGVGGERRLVDASSCPKEDGVYILTEGCEAIDEDAPNFITWFPFPFPAQVNPLDLGVLPLWNPTGDLRLEGSIPSRSGSSITYFANAALSKRWKQWSGSLSYRRQQSDSSGLGSATVADIVTGVLDWEPSPHWQTRLRIGWTRQIQETEGIQTVAALRPVDLSTAVPDLINLLGQPVGLGPAFTSVAEQYALRAVKVNRQVDVTTLWARLNVRYRLTRRITLVGDAMYWQQSSNGNVAVGRNYDRYRVYLGVQYRFEPIHL